MHRHDKIRQLIGIKPNKKVFFVRKEIFQLLSAAGVRKLDTAATTSDLLPCFFPGWVEQSTVGTHPTVENLENMIAMFTDDLTITNIVNGFFQHLPISSKRLESVNIQRHSQYEPDSKRVTITIILGDT